MKNNKKVLAIVIAVAMVIAVAIPAMAADNGVNLIDQFNGEKYNQSFSRYINSQGNNEQLAVGIVAIPKDDAGHGHTWTIVADETAEPGTVLTIAVQTQGNNYIAYVLQIDGPGEFQFSHDESLGRGFAFTVDYIVPEPPVTPEREDGSLTITKAFDGDIKEAPEGWDATFEVSDSDEGLVASVKYSEFNNGTSHVIDGLPLGDYTVSETGGEIEGYKQDVTVTGSGMITADDDASLTVTNSYTEDEPSEPPTGGRTPQNNNNRPQNDVQTPPPAEPGEILSEEEFVIVDEYVPLAAFEPEEEEVLAEETIEIADEAPPLSGMPQTGIEDTLTLWILALCIALLAAGTLSVAVVRTNKKNDI